MEQEQAFSPLSWPVSLMKSTDNSKPKSDLHWPLRVHFKNWESISKIGGPSLKSGGPFQKIGGLFLKLGVRFRNRGPFLKFVGLLQKFGVRFKNWGSISKNWGAPTSKNIFMWKIDALAVLSTLYTGGRADVSFWRIFFCLGLGSSVYLPNTVSDIGIVSFFSTSSW